MLDWSLYNSPVLADGRLCLPLSRRYQVTQASFDTLAQGGFGAGTLELTDVPEEIVMDAVKSDWLMKEIRVTDAEGNRAYEGFVRMVKGNIGRRSYARTSDTLINRVRVHYNRADPLHPGSSYAYDWWANDTASQARYGIREVALDITKAGVLSDAQAQAKGNAYLDLYKAPLAIEVEIGSANQAPPPNKVTLTLAGYWNTLGWNFAKVPFPTATEIATIIYKSGLNASLFTENITAGTTLAAQFVNTTDVTHLQTTGIAVPFNANKDFRSPQDGIKEISSYGDANSRMAFFQLWENRVPYLAIRDATAGYYVRSVDGRAWTNGRAAIQAWMVRAGKFFVDENYWADLGVWADVRNQPGAQWMDGTTYDDKTGITKPHSNQAVPDAKTVLGRVIRGVNVITNV